MAKAWKEIRNARLSKAQQARVDAWVDRELEEINLRALRDLLGITQEALAERAGISQAELSRMERRSDHRLSTVRRYVRALGGTVEVRAVFGGKTVRIDV